MTPLVIFITSTAGHFVISTNNDALLAIIVLKNKDYVSSSNDKKYF